MPAKPTGEPHHSRKRARPDPRLVFLIFTFFVLPTGCIRAYFQGPLPRTQGVESIAGIQAEVSITRDDLGIATLAGSNLADVVFAQGYAHAQDRLWQMEMSRRIASGRLAEIAGPEAVPLDRFVRIVGLRRIAARELDLLDEETRRLLTAYASGVNAYVRSLGDDFPLGFKLLDFEPEPWRPADSLVIAKLTALNLSFNWQSELVRRALLDRFQQTIGAEKLEELFPDNRSDLPTILPETPRPVGAAGAAEPTKEPTPEGKPQTAPQPTPVPGEGDLSSQEILSAFREIQPYLASVALPGSNNWVVDGTRTASGKPLLENDPHLAPQMPSIWYENRLVDRASGRWVSGVSFPGIPGVVIGRNDRIAWGFTTSFADVEDLFLERLDDVAAPRRCLEAGQWKELEVRDEWIHVRGGDDVVERVYLTPRGPLLSRWFSGKGSLIPTHQDFSFAWTGLDPSRTAEMIVRLDWARGWSDFLEAFREYSSPSQNAVYADVDGNIGYLMIGRVPIRKHGDGTLPQPGWAGEFGWTGSIPFEEQPRLVNPSSHAIVTANNRVAPPSYPHWLGLESASPFRAARITEMLSGGGNFVPQDFIRMQGDLRSLAALEILPNLLEIQPASSLERKALDELRRWDGVLAPESVGAAVYEVLLWRLLWLTFEDELGELAPCVIGEGLTPLDPSSSFFAHTADLVSRKIREDPRWAWFDDVRTPEIEGAPEVLKRALAEAVAVLRERLGSNPAEWQWGKLHGIVFQSLLSRSSLVELVFHLSRGPFPIGGDMSTVLQTAFAPGNPYGANGWVPSYRMVVDMANPAVAYVRNTTGQSGHPASPHYDDQIAGWLRNEPRRDEVRVGETEGGATVLRLVPARAETGTEVQSQGQEGKR